MKPGYSRDPQQDQIPTEVVVNYLQSISKYEKKRKEAITFLYHNQSQIPNLAIYLWFSPGTATSLLSDIISFYQNLTTGKFETLDTEFIITIFHLFKLIAADPDTRIPFVKANIPLYFFPFLQYTVTKQESLRLTAAVIGVFTSLVSQDSPEVINYLVNNQFIPICLAVLCYSCGLVQTAGAYVLLKMIQNPTGLNSICSSVEKVTPVLKFLNNTLINSSQEFSIDTAKYFTKIYNLIMESSQEIKKLVSENIPDQILTFSLKTSPDPSFKDLITNLQNLAKRRK